jgi:hypothetical protein
MAGMAVLQQIGVVCLLLGLLLCILGALCKGRRSNRFMNAGFGLACFAAIWIIGLAVL